MLLSNDSGSLVCLTFRPTMERLVDLPTELKMEICLHLPYSTIEFITNDYFWKLYSEKRGLQKHYPSFDWKTNYILQTFDHVASMYGSRLYFGHMDEKKQVADYVCQEHRYRWYHVFRVKDAGCNTTNNCANTFTVVVGGNRQQALEKLSLRSLHDFLYNREKSIVQDVRKQFTRYCSFNYISVYKHFPQSGLDVSRFNESGVLLLNKNDRCFGVLIPQACYCDWENIIVDEASRYEADPNLIRIKKFHSKDELNRRLKLARIKRILDVLRGKNSNSRRY